MALSPLSNVFSIAHVRSERNSKSDQDEKQRDQIAESEDGFFPNPISIPDEISKSEFYHKICDSPKGSAHADLCQQWRSAEAATKQARYATETFWTIIAGLVINGIGLAAIIRTLHEAKRTADAAIAGVAAAEDATKVANETLKHAIKSNRPLLVPEEGMISLANNGADGLAAKFKVFNRGTSVGFLEFIDIKSEVNGKMYSSINASVGVLKIINPADSVPFSVNIFKFSVDSDFYREIARMKSVLFVKGNIRYASLAKDRWEMDFSFIFTPNANGTGGSLHWVPNGWTDREVKPDEK